MNCPIKLIIRSNNMEERKRIKNKWVRVLYLPLAILQWSFYTLIFSGFGICSITVIGFTYGVGNLILLKTEDAKEAFMMGLMPIVIPFIWWKDYIIKGEIGMYE